MQQLLHRNTPAFMPACVSSGHMLRSGILPLRPRLHVQGAEEGVLVELGAGKAGLSGMAIIEPQTRRACNIGAFWGSTLVRDDHRDGAHL
jgi:hypothetical protein